MGVAPSTHADSRPVSLWRNLSFQLTWTSAAASGWGDRMLELAALPLLGVFGEGSQRASITAAIYFWFFLPWLVITPVGGWLADTLPRKWIMLGCDQGRALLLLVLCLLVPAGISTSSVEQAQRLVIPAWQVYAILAAAGAFAAIFAPTRNALVPQIVAPSQLNAANAIVLCIGVTASLIGYLGSYILEQASVLTGLVVSCLAYGISGFFWAFLRPRPHLGLDADRQLSEWTRLLRALSYLRQHRPVLDLVLLNGLLWTVAMVLVTAVAALIGPLGIPDSQFVTYYSLLAMMIGLGMLGGAGLVAWMNARREASSILMALLLLTSLAVALLAVNRSFVAGMVLCMGIGLAGGAAMIMVSTLTQLITPNFILGRVGGVREVLSNLAAVAVNLVIWQLPGADRKMVPALYVVAAGLALVGSWGLWISLRQGPMITPIANVLWRLCRIYTTLWHRLRWVNAHRVPRCGPVILAANHTTGLDPLLIQSPIPRMIGWVMLKSYRFRALNFVWKTVQPIAIEQDGRDLTEIRQVVERLKNGDIIGLFPEGRLQREHRQLQPFAPGLGLIARRSQAWIVPVWISGTPQTRRMLWHFLLPSRSTIAFGKAYRADPAMTNQQIVDDLYQRLQILAANKAMDINGE